MPRRKLDRPNYRLRDRDGTWYVDWTEGGRTRSVSTGERERKEAERWRDQWVAGRDQPLPPTQPTISEILRAYTAARIGHVENKKAMLQCGKTIARLIGNLEPRMLSRSSYISARNAGGTSSLSFGTVRREVAVLRAALRWSMRERWLSEIPYVEMPERPPPRDRWLTHEEVDHLIHAAATYHIKLFIIMAYHTAARTGAILDLTWDRVDLERRLVHYRRPGRRETKKRRATVPLNRTALTALQEAFLLRTSDHVIEYNGRGVRDIKTGFITACRNAGITGCTPHVLRHTAASHLVMAGVPLGEVARMLGDSEAMVEKVYGKWAPDYLRRAADALASGPVAKIRHKSDRR